MYDIRDVAKYLLCIDSLPVGYVVCPIKFTITCLAFAIGSMLSESSLDGGRSSQTRQRQFACLEKEFNMTPAMHDLPGLHRRTFRGGVALPPSLSHPPAPG